MDFSNAPLNNLAERPATDEPTACSTAPNKVMEQMVVDQSAAFPNGEDCVMCIGGYVN